MVERTARRHDPENDEHQRTRFERDRDAIVHSNALRRLAGVTQVVSPSEGHVFHNRLTHTLEVAQIAQRLAEKIRGENDVKLLESYGGLDVNVVEAAALAHDLGHPPFGHVAEHELDRLVLEEKSPSAEGFEGNAQAFRILTKLAVRQIDSPGLNLTAAVLNATLKYPYLQENKGTETPPKPAHRKWGAYRSERDDLAFARKLQDRNREDWQSLEAEIMDWSDDIAYAVSDTEDFFRAGLIPLDRFLREERFPDDFASRVFDRWRDLDIVAECTKKSTANEQAEELKKLGAAFQRLIWEIRFATAKPFPIEPYLENSVSDHSSGRIGRIGVRSEWHFPPSDRLSSLDRRVL